MGKPDHGMFGIKLIKPEHLDMPHFAMDFDGRDGRRTLMNFADGDRGLAIAGNIPVGHRALVYVTAPISGFVWAIEFTGTLAEAAAAARAHGLRGDEYGHWNQMRLIRIIARINDPEKAVSPTEILTQTGFDFRPNSFTHTYISRADYDWMHAAIPWDTR